MSSGSRAWGTIREDAMEDAYESLHILLKDAERALVQVKGVAAVQRSKRKRVEAELDAVVTWMGKSSEEIRSKPSSVSSAALVLS